VTSSVSESPLSCGDALYRTFEAGTGSGGGGRTRKAEICTRPRRSTVSQPPPRLLLREGGDPATFVGGDPAAVVAAQ